MSLTKQPGKVILRCTKVEKNIRKKSIIKGFSMTVRKGELVTVFSKTGQSKSVLAKLICGLVPPTYGTVTVRGKAAGYRTNTLVSFQPDVPFLKQEHSVTDVMVYYNRFFSDFKYKRAYKLLKLFGIDPEAYIWELDESLVTVFEIILVSSRKTSLYVFDNPFKTDKKYHADIIKILNACKQVGGVVVLSDRAYEYMEPATDRFIFLNRGEMIISIESEKIKLRYNQSATGMFKELYRNA